MKYISGLLVALVMSVIMTSTASAEIHDNGYVGNGRVFHDIKRPIIRGGVEYPVFYTSRDDVYAFSFDYVVAEMKNIYYDRQIAQRHGVRFTTYPDLDITLFIADSPMEVMELYEKLKDEPMISYHELALFEAHPDMKMGVVELTDMESPIGNNMLWFTVW